MKQITFLLLLLSCISCHSQQKEFNEFANGLIYSDTTMRQLKFIVDSLHLKFKACNLSRTYLSTQQAKANYVRLDTGAIKMAMKDMNANISFDDFVKKYPAAKVDKALLVLKEQYKDYQQKEVITVNGVAFIPYTYTSVTCTSNLEKLEAKQKGTWIYEYRERTTYSKETLTAFYFLDNFAQRPIPEAYARMVQYVDCMADTATKVIYSNAVAERGLYEEKEGTPTTVDSFMAYVSKSTQMPEYEGEYDAAAYSRFHDQLQDWEAVKQARIDSLRSKSPRFDQLLEAAVKEAIEKGGSSDDFESYVALYKNPAILLEVKRHRMVIGGCSMDLSPRIHALNIAKLSAETVNWEVFLRAHLDIMNDNFSRNSDGSYAWEKRQTYIKELEILDINVTDLLLGICLRLDNAASNHYYGNIDRVGRTLAESAHADEVATKMLQMIANDQLDDYNRVLIYFLFQNFNYYLANKEQQTHNNEKLLTAVKTMPEYLSSKMK